MQNGRRVLQLFGAVCLAGLLVGMSLPELFHMGTGSYAGFFSLYSFQKYERTAIKPWELFPYIASGRLEALILLRLGAYSAAGLWLHLLYGGWLCTSAGMLLALFCLRDGREGILLFGCCLLPQWILYGAAWKREFQFYLRRQFPGTAVLMASGGRLRADFARTALLLLAGCAVGAFLGLWTLKLYLQL